MTADLWQRAFVFFEHDQKERVFFSHPLEPILRKGAKDEWLATLARQVESATYVPSHAKILDTPKPKWHSRPGALLSCADQVVYHYIGLKCLELIRPRLRALEGTVRFSNILAKNNRSWFARTFSGWKRFSEATATLLPNAEFIVETDVAGYYENIDIGRLIRELSAEGVDPFTIALMEKCLNKWAYPRGRGLLQGFSPSDLLAEYYMDAIDRHLKGAGLAHVRYMDDMRIATINERDARIAQLKLTAFLRDRGLNLQTSKTVILPKSAAMEHQRRLETILSRVAVEVATELTSIGVPDPNVSMSQLQSRIRNVLKTSPSKPAIEVLERTFGDFVSGALGEWDKTILHYLLHRLSESGSLVALDFAVQLLSEHPEETLDGLRYVASSPPGERRDEAVTRIAQLVRDNLLLFDYQVYQIFRWAYDSSIQSSALAEAARSTLRQARHYPPMRYHAIAFLGRHAEMTDWEELETIYRNSTDPLERATVVGAFKDAPAALRGKFLGRARGDGELIDLAVAWATSTGA